MTAPRVTVVVGNPTPASRTRALGEALATRILPSARATTIELAEHRTRLFEWQDAALGDLSAQVAASDLVVFASPTYKATYTGLLKAFLDRYPADGLAGVVAIPLHTGAAMSHAMGPTFTLAPLLAELGAVVPGAGVYVPVPEYESGVDVLAAPVERIRRNLARLAALAPALDAPALDTPAMPRETGALRRDRAPGAPPRGTDPVSPSDAPPRGEEP